MKKLKLIDINYIVPTKMKAMLSFGQLI